MKIRLRFPQCQGVEGSDGPIDASNWSKGPGLGHQRSRRLSCHMELASHSGSLETFISLWSSYLCSIYIILTLLYKYITLSEISVPTEFSNIQNLFALAFDTFLIISTFLRRERLLRVYLVFLIGWNYIFFNILLKKIFSGPLGDKYCAHYCHCPSNIVHQLLWRRHSKVHRWPGGRIWRPKEIKP